MLRPRFIVSLLMHRGALVKTVKFANPKYIGDPINAVRIFNEKEVDELFVADIDVSRSGTDPNYGTISKLAAECRMPLCYGGGVRTLAQVEKIISIGVEKVALGAAAIDNPRLIEMAAKRVGQQSVTVVIDAKLVGQRKYAVVSLNGTRTSGTSPVQYAKDMQARGAGEIILNSVDRDGTMSGFDLELVAQVREAITVPLTVLGGAGSLDDIRAVIKRFGVLGVAAGSLFVFKGRFRAVLINYPLRADKERLWLSEAPSV